MGDRFTDNHKHPHQKNRKQYILSHLKLYEKIDRQCFKIFLFGVLRKVIYEYYSNLIQHELERNNNSTMECYIMDSKIIQLIIKELVESGEYTLEGIAFHTRIPFDIILDAVCGASIHLSITSWMRIVELFIQIRPEVSQMIIDKLIELKNNDFAYLFSLLNTP